jgi:predicted metal-dependent hydrolase
VSLGVSPLKFKARVKEWASKLNVEPSQVRLQRMTRKWGSCSTSGWVTFDLGLTNESQGFQDYVIVHELLHLKVPNHGKLFKSYLKAYLPDWEKTLRKPPNITRILENYRTHAS